MSIEFLEQMIVKMKGESKYEIDGIVIQNDKQYERNIDGNPEYMFAFKMIFDVFTTIVESIEWNVSKWGQIKPVAILEPIECGGITISRATAHNAKYVEDNNLGKGSVVLVTRSKEVIPYILDILESTHADMPDIPYSWDENHVNIIINTTNNDMCFKIIANFFSELGIKHISEATVEKLMNNGLDTLLKIIKASKNRILQVPEFQEKSAERIYTNIRNGLQDVSIANVLGACGVFGFGIGKKKIELLFHSIPDILEQNPIKLKPKVLQVEGFSDITADKVVENIVIAKMFIKAISPYATFKKEIRTSNKFLGQKYVMSGFRDKDIEEKIVQMGGQMVGSVSKNTTALIVASNAGRTTGKAEKAMQLNIPVFTREEFTKKFL
jgi:DNA ligase (NAD+)